MNTHTMSDLLALPTEADRMRPVASSSGPA